MSLISKSFTVAVVLAVATAAPAAAGRPQPPADTQPPSVPGDLHPTSVEQTSVSLAWNQSTDDRQVVLYGVWAPGVPVIYVNHPATTATFTGLHPGTTYAFRVQAWDGMNWSWPSDIAGVTTSPDVVAPSAPTGLALADSVYGSPVDGVTASTALLTWTNSSDDFGPIRYQVLVNGVVSPDVYDTRTAGSPITATSRMWVRHLPPGTTSTITVRSVDGGGNVSAVSNVITVTTDASSDVVAPTVPSLIRAGDGGTGTCPEELWLAWTASTDDSVSGIEYEVRVNGVINEVLPGGTDTITYTEVGGANVVTIIAVDKAGNASAPSNAITVNVNCGGDCVL